MSAMEKLEYIADLGFTQVQLMPLTEHSDAWGYNPRQLMSLQGAYGTPDDLRRFVSPKQLTSGGGAVSLANHLRGGFKIVILKAIVVAPLIYCPLPFRWIVRIS